MRRYFLIVSVLILITGCTNYSNRSFVDVAFNEDNIEVEATDGTYMFEYYHADILEVNFIPTGESYEDSSHAVVMESDFDVEVEIEETARKLVIDTDGIDIHIKKDPMRVEFFRDGERLIRERAGYKRDTLEILEFSLDRNEALYGAGARALGMDRRGHRLPLYNKAHYGYGNFSEQLNYSLPIVLSSKQYMLHFDNAPIGFLDFDSEGDNTLSYETISGRKTYQVVAGDHWMEIMDHYTQLTGRHQLLPRWALGNFSSRFGYHSQKEVIETISKFKEDEIPVDAIIIDLYWFGKEIQYTLGNFEFYADSFPDPNRMIQELRDMDVETILINEPFVVKTSTRWEEALEKEVLAVDSTGEAATFEFYFGDGGIIDVYDEKGYNWYADIVDGLLDRGVTGIWGDLGEPEAHPSYVIHATGTADEVHNTYGHDWARLVYNTFQERDPDSRPFILMRAGAAGSQRYGLVPWSGDVSRSWDGLSRQPEIAMQMGMQGLAYMHSDLGGFTPGDRDPELYLRWLQFGVFQPIFRPHANESLPSEPVFWDDTTKAIAKTAIDLRYQMLPYNYSLAWENHRTGAPLMRPLIFEEPTNSNMKDYDAAYLWGDSFLIAPILNPGVETKEVYLPNTSDWFDFYSGEKYKGGKTVTVPVDMSSIPTFVRAGAIIPMAKSMQTTKEYDGNRIELHYFADFSGDTTTFELYNDDGLTFDAYEKGMSELLTFTATSTENVISIEMSGELGENYPANQKEIELVLHNMESSSITVTGYDDLAVTVDLEKKTVSIPLIWDPSKAEKIEVRF